MKSIEHEKYKNIIFDVGAVLVSWNPTEIMERTFADAPHLKPDAQTFFEKELVGDGVFFRMDKGLLNYEDVENLLAQRIDRFYAAKLLKEGVNLLTPLPAGISIFNEIKGRGYKTYILSNMSERALQKISAENDFVRQVDGAIWSYQVKTAKPEPEIYQILLKTYALKPEECIFIDDREDNIVAAKTHGIDGIICKNHDYVRQELRHLKII
jgi:putative hydrolase of the HAD superfamily